jgi:hypothetical protein
MIYANPKQSKTAEIVQALAQGPLTAKGLADAFLFHPDSMRRCIRRAHDEGKIHVCGWDVWSAVYAVGPGVDVPYKKLDPKVVRANGNKHSAERKRIRTAEAKKAAELAIKAAQARKGRQATWFDALMVAV